VLQTISLIVVDFDNLFEGVAEQIVVIGRVRDFQLCLVKGHFSGGTLSWCLSLAFGIDLSGRVKNLVELGLIL